MRFRHSLLARYLLIIMVALILWPFVLPAYYIPSYFLDKDVQQKAQYIDTNKLKQMWHHEAAKLDRATPEQIDQKLHTLKDQYPLASMFWVDGAGKTKLVLSKQKNIPSQWTLENSIEFMNQSDGDPITFVSYIGRDQSNGFMVFQIPPSVTKLPTLSFIDDKFLAIYGFLVFGLFLFVSWLFFFKIRKRLVHLQTAMTETKENGIPEKIVVDKKDEISELGKAFNYMVDELIKSRQHEQEEEALRKQLIANISHDLRTPLTTIRGHAYSLQKEPLSSKGKDSLHLIENKVDLLSHLLENLLSYTLLSARKYTLQRKETDIIRFIRESMAGWYPVFEKEGFKVDVNLPEKAMIWNIDPQWFMRILDNLYQNVMRHAKSGRYVGVRIVDYEGKTAILIEDRGPGLDVTTDKKGAGIGLSIVSLMLQEMQLGWTITSSPKGTEIYLYEKK
ncbi:Adaptive-response sensory-kinase SasA [Neobacillus rhizosphaerae]|uniref:histidine kinase n=1 Tax=Neobacillus rhizosphaerae TaxID=2880965 RepID=A0ABM9EXS7_9BACI|nr:HAMP domain-containing sensor histidine kinase [Neobacillus rhizosphaerae]CAH2717055.1 Adaptive-response sensory-kinase SasA [Neobacillus rhizosphaerae]